MINTAYAGGSLTRRDARGKNSGPHAFQAVESSRPARELSRSLRVRSNRSTLREHGLTCKACSHVREAHLSTKSKGRGADNIPGQVVAVSASQPRRRWCAINRLHPLCAAHRYVHSSTKKEEPRSALGSSESLLLLLRGVGAKAEKAIRSRLGRAKCLRLRRRKRDGLGIC